MKVINKQLLLAKGYERYAIAEARILRTVRHPFILSMYFAFQVLLTLRFRQRTISIW